VRSPIYVSSFAADPVSVVDLSSLRVVAEIEVVDRPVEMTLDDREHTLFVSNWSDGTVSFVDLDGLEEVAVVQSCSIPLGLVFTKREGNSR
jgi:YVTN family beta-propeller protein